MAGFMDVSHVNVLNYEGSIPYTEGSYRMSCVCVCVVCVCVCVCVSVSVVRRNNNLKVEEVELRTK